ncbi:MAG: hypothetical protein NTX57_14410 [Armatimonadetes bacterium]|jgi:hypothetical protein|nr:hypothetical protein [Armatimonadota bacterium]
MQKVLKTLPRLCLVGLGFIFSGCGKQDEVIDIPNTNQPAPRSASRDLQAKLNLTEDQKSKLQEIRRKYTLEAVAIEKKYVELTKPYQAEAMASGRGGKSMDPKTKAALDAIVAKKNGELEPLKAKQKEEEQAIYTPEQKKILEEFAAKK